MQLLIVSPRFPPTDAVDMHRVRMNVRYYREHGWEPTVLSVEPTYADRLVDHSLAETLPADLEVRRVAALPSTITRALGVTDVALRSFAYLRAAGDELIRKKRPDLVFFSTTAFLTMPLGVRWRRRFGVPFVLDFQDPWHAIAPEAALLRRTGVKHALMCRLHGIAESRTAPLASGLLSVSETYIEVLREAYPNLWNVPTDTIPFGFASTDFVTAQRLGKPWQPFENDQCTCATPLTMAYTGRFAPDMDRSLHTLSEVLVAAASQQATPLDTIRVAFLGTGYQKTGNPAVVMAYAASRGLGERIRERPDRLSLLDALKTILVADVLLILGSDDLAYQPSKLFQYLSLRKPILCVAPAGGRLAEFVRGLESVVFVPTGASNASLAARVAAARLARLLGDPDFASFGEHAVLADRYSAETLAGRECALFDRAVAFAHSNS